MSEQSEPIFGPEIEVPVLSDIIFLPAIEKARRINEILKQTPIASDDDHYGYKNDLDDMWPYLDGDVIVTGKLVTPALEVDSEYRHFFGDVKIDGKVADGDEITFFAETEKCTSQGFALVEVGAFYADGMYLGKQYAAKLAFNRDVELQTEDGKSIVCITECYADINEAVVQLDEFSPNHNNYVADQYFNDYLVGVDEKLIEGNFAASLMAIKDLLIPYGQYITEQEQKALQHSLNEYLHTYSNQEQYAMQLNPDTVLFEPGELQSVVGLYAAGKALVTMYSLEVQNKVIVKVKSINSADIHTVPSEFEIRLILQLNRISGTEDEVCSIRLLDIEALKSVREMQQTILEAL